MFSRCEDHYLRIVIFPRPHERQVGPRCLRQFVEAQGRASFLAAKVVIARIGDDAQQPRAEVAVLEARQRAVHLDQGVLDSIRGGLFSRHDVLRQSLRCGLVVSDKLPKCKVIAQVVQPESPLTCPLRRRMRAPLEEAIDCR